MTVISVGFDCQVLQSPSASNNLPVHTLLKSIFPLFYRELCLATGIGMKVESIVDAINVDSVGCDYFVIIRPGCMVGPGWPGRWFTGFILSCDRKIMAV